MSYDEGLDDRVADVVLPWGTTRKKMFGGTCYLLNGNMVAGVYRESLILRLGEDEGFAALSEPNVRPFDITGRPMKGWVMVEQEGLDERSLVQWLDRAHDFAASLPPKN